MAPISETRAQRCRALAPEGEHEHRSKHCMEVDERSDSGGSTSVGDDTLALEEIASVPSGLFSSSQPHLVWCHERCHKRENQGLRTSLGKAASVICLKKANKFVSWCQRSRGQPYVLLTDWREVKPCLAFLATARIAKQPLLTIVLCDDPEAKIFSRAVAWARSLGPEVGPLHICKDLGSVLGLLETVQCQEQGGSTTARKAEMEKLQPVHALPVPPVDDRQQQPQQQQLLLLPLANHPMVCQSSKEVSPMLLSWCPIAETSRVATSWVQGLLAGYGPCNSQEVEQLLRASAPAVYED